VLINENKGGKDLKFGYTGTKVDSNFLGIFALDGVTVKNANASEG